MPQRWDPAYAGGAEAAAQTTCKRNHNVERGAPLNTSTVTDKHCWLVNFSTKFQKQAIQCLCKQDTGHPHHPHRHLFRRRPLALHAGRGRRYTSTHNGTSKLFRQLLTFKTVDVWERTRLELSSSFRPFLRAVASA